MRRAVQIVLTLVLFSAAMEGLNFLAGDGISPNFGCGVVFGGLLGMAIVGLIIDREYCPPFSGFVFTSCLILASLLCGAAFQRSGFDAHIVLGAAVGFGLIFPVTYWTVGMERAARGFPRRPFTWAHFMGRDIGHDEFSAH